MQALAAGLVDMAGERATAAAMGRAGRERVEQQFSLRSMVASYQSLYDRLLAERSMTTQPT